METQDGSLIEKALPGGNVGSHRVHFMRRIDEEQPDGSAEASGSLHRVAPPRIHPFPEFGATEIRAEEVERVDATRRRGNWVEVRLSLLVFW